MDNECKLSGRSFQTRDPETAKLRDPYVLVLVLGTIRSPRHSRSLAMAQFNNPHYFLLVVCSNCVSLLHRFRNINICLAYVSLLIVTMNSTLIQLQHYTIAHAFLSAVSVS